MEDLTFGELQELRKDGSVADEELRARQRLGIDDDSSASKKKKKSKKKNKAPLELSSKKKPSKFVEVVKGPKRNFRDPRFESFTGHYNPDLFEKSYGFLDNMKNRELEQLRTTLKTERDPEQREVIQQAIQLLQQQLQVKKKNTEVKQLKSDIKKVERERVKSGKKPFYIKPGEINKLLVSKKFEEMKGKKSLEKLLEKKLKRRASKDRRRIPSERVDDEHRQEKRRKLSEQKNSTPNE